MHVGVYTMMVKDARDPEFIKCGDVNGSKMNNTIMFFFLLIHCCTVMVMFVLLERERISKKKKIISMKTCQLTYAFLTFLLPSSPYHQNKNNT